MQKKQTTKNKTKKFNTLTIIILGLIIIFLFYSYKALFPDEYTNPPQLDRDAPAMGGDIDDYNEYVVTPISYDPNDIDLNYLIENFSFLQNPLPGTVISWKDSHLPGAKRPYRSGIHHGLDFYAIESGGGITLGSWILAAAPGTVIRIDHNYKLPTLQELNELSNQSRELGKTPDDILDIFRGRQIWIEHEKGFVIRYCHLEEVSELLQEGDHVETGDQIGTMGYSGTTEPDRPHLHLEIWFGDNYLGEGMTVKEIRNFFQATIFDNS